ncbi:hypothetical protein [Streptomyces sp. bgisy154]|uniref:hypothetical protein n=1 Tax=Streptomyces sp. bgisy154 TaxID=3413794 RepID=UPI003D742FE2
MPDMPTRRLRRPLVMALVTAIACAALAGGLVLWLLRDTGEDSDSCDILIHDTQVRKALGNDSMTGMGCSTLGEAIKDATVGSVDPSQPRRHSLTQAQAMKDVLVAAENSLRETNERLEPALRTPLAQALAAYSADTHVILGLGNADYVRHALPTQPAWEDENGVHMSVPRTSMLRIMRSISEDPAAYAILRKATTLEAAEDLTSVTSDTTGPELAAPPSQNSAVLGAFDAIAEDIREDIGSGRAGEWQHDVFIASTKDDSTPTSYTQDPVAYLVASWWRTLREGGPTSSTETFEQQSSAMVDTWSTALGLDGRTRSSLQEDALNDSFRARREALRNLS